MKSNPRITPKDRALIKGALRRVFSRSELRLGVLLAGRIFWDDPNRPRVTKWSRCTECKMPTPEYLVQVDHVAPVVPANTDLASMSLDELADRMWCAVDNLKILCKPCHKKKTLHETRERNRLKKERGLK